MKAIAYISVLLYPKVISGIHNIIDKNKVAKNALAPDTNILAVLYKKINIIDKRQTSIMNNPRWFFSNIAAKALKK